MSELIVVAYFLYLGGIAALMRSAPSRARVGAAAPAIIIVTIWLSHAESGMALVIRDWAPVAYLMAMYRVPAALVSSPDLAFERMLVSIDWRWMHGSRWIAGGSPPRAVIEMLELAYLFCYPLIPVGMACLLLQGAAAEVDRYWTSVLLAAALCYGVLPWLPTRPPRTMYTGSTRSMVRTLNLRLIRQGSVQWNTFPSGHVATSLAAAFAVGAALPATGAPLFLLALGIAVASLVGRYHYAADVVAGAGVAVFAFTVSRLV
jgi:membrane-associated phospholipid phosphatase